MFEALSVRVPATLNVPVMVWVSPNPLLKVRLLKYVVAGTDKDCVLELGTENVTVPLLWVNVPPDILKLPRLTVPTVRLPLVLVNVPPESEKLVVVMAAPVPEPVNVPPPCVQPDEPTVMV